MNTTTSNFTSTIPVGESPREIIRVILDCACSKLRQIMTRACREWRPGCSATDGKRCNKAIATGLTLWLACRLESAFFLRHRIFGVRSFPSTDRSWRTHPLHYGQMESRGVVHLWKEARTPVPSRRSGYRNANSLERTSRVFCCFICSHNIQFLLKIVVF